MRYISFFLLFTIVNLNAFSQNKKIIQETIVEPIFPLGIRYKVDPKTGKPKICDSFDPTIYDSNPEYAPQPDLACYIYYSDSTMKVILNKILDKLGRNSVQAKKLMMEQNQWKVNTKNTALKEGDKYLGGTMEISEIYRITYVKIIERTKYLKSILKKVNT